MSELRILVRLRNTPDALERLVSLMRRRAVPLRRLSVSMSGDEVIEVCLRVDQEKMSRDRIRAELGSLVDVLEVRDGGDQAALLMREMLLVRVRSNRAKLGRLLGRTVPGIDSREILEITGTPDDVDAALRRLQAGGLVASFVRSGDLALPDEPNPNPIQENVSL